MDYPFRILLMRQMRKFILKAPCLTENWCSCRALYILPVKETNTQYIVQPAAATDYRSCFYYFLYKSEKTIAVEQHAR